MALSKKNSWLYYESRSQPESRTCSLLSTPRMCCVLIWSSRQGRQACRKRSLSQFRWQLPYSSCCTALSHFLLQGIFPKSSRPHSMSAFPDHWYAFLDSGYMKEMRHGNTGPGTSHLRQSGRRHMQLRHMGLISLNLDRRDAIVESQQGKQPSDVCPQFIWDRTFTNLRATAEVIYDSGHKKSATFYANSNEPHNIHQALFLFCGDTPSSPTAAWKVPAVCQERPPGPFDSCQSWYRDKNMQTLGRKLWKGILPDCCAWEFCQAFEKLPLRWLEPPLP